MFTITKKGKMKPHIKNSSIRVRNRKKYNSVPRKQRRQGFKVANPTDYIDTIGTGSHVIRNRYKKTKGLTKDVLKEYMNDKI